MNIATLCPQLSNYKLTHGIISYETQICIVVTNIIMTSGNKTNPHCMINNERLQHQVKKCHV
jgi:hypothetical protein